ncbi:hypothetical protein AVEN_54345-1 [Araneus ventricosus]|uniref:Pre-C2HC domain-containing protein n=1 Tax=Araneus ventricosus TaxID=182803 RepID=A0A4Y2FBM4_ARAVE|nr:hypothetical protein AVEN_54345-1 [Araneus ventricosus]
MKVEIQRFQRRTGALQCFNCNHHHHAAAACQLSPRCLKCGGPHSHVQCTEKFETNQEGKIKNPVCINCGESGHLASWRGCRMFPKTAVNNYRQIKTARRVDPKISFSAITRENLNKDNASLKDNMSVYSEQDDMGISQPEVSVTVTPQKVDALKDIIYILNEFKRIFGKTDFNAIVQKLKSTDNDVDKIQVIVNSLSLST